MNPLLLGNNLVIMASENVRGADDQQERLEIANWICGFVDGEGCFSVSLIRNKTTGSGWQIFPEFVVTQGEKSRSALEAIQDYFGCGRIYKNHRHDNHTESLLRYCVRSRRDLNERIIPFFQKFPLRTAKLNDFEKFVSILQCMDRGEHMNSDGLHRIANIIQNMNRKVPSRFLKSSETIRQDPDESSGKIESGLHGDMQRTAEMSVPIAEIATISSEIP